MGPFIYIMHMKPDIYNIKVSTYRRTLQLIVWWWKKYFDKEFGDTGLEYELNNWVYMYDKENNCNVIWLDSYDLSVLVHELVHCMLEMLEQVWEEADGEAPAYIYEEMFTSIWLQCWKKFKLSKDVKKFYTK